MPSLNETKCNLALSQFNEQFIYAFGGESKLENSISSHIEQIDLKASVPAWKLLDVKLPQKMHSLGALQISDTQILLLGGKLS